MREERRTPQLSCLLVAIGVVATRVSGCGRRLPTPDAGVTAIIGRRDDVLAEEPALHPCPAGLQEVRSAALLAQPAQSPHGIPRMIRLDSRATDRAGLRDGGRIRHIVLARLRPACAGRLVRLWDQVLPPDRSRFTRWLVWQLEIRIGVADHVCAIG